MTFSCCSYHIVNQKYIAGIALGYCSSSCLFFLNNSLKAFLDSRDTTKLTNENSGAGALLDLHLEKLYYKFSHYTMLLSQCKRCNKEFELEYIHCPHFLQFNDSGKNICVCLCCEFMFSFTFFAYL